MCSVLPFLVKSSVAAISIDSPLAQDGVVAVPRPALVSVIVPALNEAKSLPELFARTEKVFLNLGIDFEFILIDDGSTDETESVFSAISSQHPRSILVQHTGNQGKSVALMQGFAIASGDVAITMDADLQDQPEMIPRFLDKLEEGYDLVNGWRHLRKDTARKRFISHIYNGLTNHFLRCNLHDINCGFKAMRNNVYRKLELRGDLHRLIPVLAINLGFRVTEVPIEHQDRIYGQSKYRLLRHRGLLDIISVAASRTTQLRPFHLFFEIGVVFVAMGFLFGGGWIFLSLSGMSSPVERLVTSISGFFAAFFFCFGAGLPLVGFVVDTLAMANQDSTWRKKLIKAIKYRTLPDSHLPD
jgi:glycosyltransferase involved in cell wall biosynthesis